MREADMPDAGARAAFRMGTLAERQRIVEALRQEAEKGFDPALEQFYILGYAAGLRAFADWLEATGTTSEDKE